jgi:hypothetical protein
MTNDVPVIEHINLLFADGATGGQTAFPAGKQPTDEQLASLAASTFVFAAATADADDETFLRMVVQEYNQRKKTSMVDRVVDNE